MRVINITGQKPKSRVIDNIQRIKSRGRCMHTNHFTIIHKTEMVL